MSDIKINESVLAEKAQKFDKFVHFIDKNDQPISFLNPDGVLDREEGYKRNKPSRSQEILNEFEWNESWIGSGKIKERIFKVMDIADNLVNFNARIDFRKHFETDLKDYNPESEQVIYEIYKGDDDKAAFEHAIQVFGARYSVLAYRAGSQASSLIRLTALSGETTHGNTYPSLLPRRRARGEYDACGRNAARHTADALQSA